MRLEIREVRRMNLVDLKPAEYNPRIITDEAFDGLGNSISRYGMLSHIVWNKRSGNIVGGHQRYKHLLETGETETDVVVVDLDDNEEVALNITLNNRCVRGDFTKEVIEQLRVSEAQLGSAFSQIGLLNLFEHLKGRGFDKKKKESKKTTGKSDGETHGGSSDSSEEDTSKKGDGKPQAVIICPKCKSQWKLADNEIVYNGVLNTGNKVGVN